MQSSRFRIMSVAGARPNFMKLAAIARAIEKYNITEKTIPLHHVIVHTGQHYDTRMSQAFFDDLGIPRPDINLEVGSGSHAQQTAEIIRRFEKVLVRECPDVLIVVGDVNSTIACALVAAKIEYPATRRRKRPLVVHVEAGLRSFDRDMPEEINRILTDAISDILFVTEQSGIDNLRHEGIPDDKIRFVGNVMIDTLQMHLEHARQSEILHRIEARPPFGVVTLHRPSNVDRPESLSPLLDCLDKISRNIPLYFPVHPRTLERIKAFDKLSLFNCCHHPELHAAARPNRKNDHKLFLLPPLGYIDFLRMVSKSTLVITDSGGIQEETTYLGIPCMTLRNSTERPVTVDVGSNHLVGTDPSAILVTAERILAGEGKQASVPPLWDGHAGERIVASLVVSLKR